MKVDWPGKLIASTLKSWGVTHVLEIGPGGGILTGALLTADLRVTAIEKDERFATALSANIADSLNRDSISAEQLCVVTTDIREFDLAQWIAQIKVTVDQPKFAVVGNIPYKISTEILEWVLPRMSLLEGVVLMTQKEFAERACSKPDCKEYGSLSVFVQLRAEARLLSQVSRKHFKPVPKVDSSILTLQPKNTPAAESELMPFVEKLTKHIFSQRRKILRNPLMQFLHPHEELINQLNIDLNRRAATLSPEEFLSLALEIKRLLGNISMQEN